MFKMLFFSVFLLLRLEMCVVLVVHDLTFLFILLVEYGK